LPAVQAPGVELGEQRKNMQLKALSNEFYTKVPHQFHHSKTPPVITSQKQLKEKLDLMEALKAMASGQKAITMDRLDEKYASLNCGLKRIDRETNEFNVIEKYLAQTHGSTHYFSMALEELFAVDRAGEAGRYQKFEKLHNKQLLWHGSRLTNWCGIFSQGLRIAPPEAPVTGYMFGKGVYFANMASKSANYCGASQDEPVGILLLCEVALGDLMPLRGASYTAGEDCVKAGKHSVWGMGRTCPDPKDSDTLEGVHVPLGKGTDAVVEGDGPPLSLMYDEFIVYDECQIKMKYALKVRFDWKKRGMAW